MFFVVVVVVSLSLFIFHGHSTREPASSRVTYFIFRAYTGFGVAANAGKKIGRAFGKNAGEWTGKVKIRKKFLAVSVACMTIY